MSQAGFAPTLRQLLPSRVFARPTFWSGLFGLLALPSADARAQVPVDNVFVLDDGVQGRRVSTGARTVHLLLHDGSTVTAAPDTELTIDQGTPLVLSVARGTARIVRGRRAAGASTTIETPAATIDAAGSVGLVDVDATGTTEFMQGVGTRTTATARATGETRTVSRNGFALRIASERSITATPIARDRLDMLIARSSDPAMRENSLGADLPTLSTDRAPTDLRSPAETLQAVERLTQPLVAGAAQTIATGNTRSTLPAIGSTTTAITTRTATSAIAAAASGRASPAGVNTTSAGSGVNLLSTSSLTVVVGSADLIFAALPVGTIITIAPGTTLPPGTVFPPGVTIVTLPAR